MFSKVEFVSKHKDTVHLKELDKFVLIEVVITNIVVITKGGYKSNLIWGS